jgi:two-component sensor histidine kinase
MSFLEQTGRIGPYEKEYILADGSRRWILFAGRRIEPNLIAEYAIDIDGRKRAEEDRELLSRELSHRVKNSLAVVQALARRTGGRTVEEFRQALDGRLGALAEAHGLLLADDWRSADLHELVGRAMAPYGAGDGGRVRIDGEPVQVSAQQALSLSLVLHELGTNALKYGALSAATGHVRIGWRVATDGGARVLRLRWEERGGPEVVQPTEDGFGSELIVRAAEYDLQGSSEIRWQREGLSFDLRFPVE